MTPPPMPEKWEKEYDRLIEIWYTYADEVDFDVVVEEHGSKEFQKYYFKEKRKTEALRKRGIIVN